MEITEDMIIECESNPMPSKSHAWRPGYKDQAAYDVLPAKGRTLYDNLRTQFDVPHGDAFGAALDRYGLCETLFI